MFYSCFFGCKEAISSLDVFCFRSEEHLYSFPLLSSLHIFPFCIKFILHIRLRLFFILFLGCIHCTNICITCIYLYMSVQGLLLKWSGGECALILWTSLELTSLSMSLSNLPLHSFHPFRLNRSKVQKNGCLYGQHILNASGSVWAFHFYRFCSCRDTWIYHPHSIHFETRSKDLRPETCPDIWGSVFWKVWNM